MSAISLFDLNGEQRFTGTSVGGGGSQPVIARAQYSGNAVSIANGGSDVLTWDSKDSGTALLNLSTPGQPTIVTAGVYAVTIVVRGAALTVGGTYSATLDLDASGEDPQIAQDSAASKAGAQTITTALAMTYYIPAGGVVQAQIAAALDGAATRNYNLALGVIQRLS